MRDSTKAEFVEAYRKEAEALAESLWARVVEQGEGRRADEWLADASGEVQRAGLGRALTAFSERTEPRAECACGGAFVFRERRCAKVHTILPGRDASVTLRYFQCQCCGKGLIPAARELRLCPEGFTEALRELGLRAAVLEPYQGAAELMQQFARVRVSPEKMLRLVEQAAVDVSEFQACARETTPIAPPGGRVIVGIDGGFLHVDGRWQEVKVAIFFEDQDLVSVSQKRRALVRREVIAVRGDTDALIALIKARLGASATELHFVVLSDGAHWIRRVAQECFPQRTQILDWYHLAEHVHAAARVIYGSDESTAAAFAKTQLDLLDQGLVSCALDALRFVEKSVRRKPAREALESLRSYLSDNSDRVDYPAYRYQHLPIGSGCVESAIGHVLQQRMKRAGMHWQSRGADSMIALRSLFRSFDQWDRFLEHRRRAA